MIKAVFASLAILLGVGLCASDQVAASSCGRAEVQAACAGHAHVVPLRRGQIRRANRRAARLHRRAERQAHGSCGYAEVRVGCSGVSVIAPVAVVEVPACCD